ncbi:heavy metal translocating P-type ATPase [Caulobacter sp. FWC2]|uniref:heavy metal translocating P-type ATPase n=1 Tax=Caulobacter sp. FWC2 TaxID=69664 RepID=UPI000C152DE6|nr:heavy metal translocating P-type ATPase [Caulobacter sp. FWC2]PIB92764.1 heavy metal translocating P-type ATPase [Caulobacter sp. FWC2]
MQVSYPRDGALRIAELGFLAQPEGVEAKRFLSTLFRMPEVRSVEIAPNRASADILFDRPLAPAEMARRMGAQSVVGELDEDAKLPVLSPDQTGRVQLHRYGSVVSTWSIVSDIPGRMRFRNDHLFRKKQLCQDIERELMTVFGIDRFKVNPQTCSLLVHFDPTAIDRWQLLEFLDQALRNAQDYPSPDKNNHELLVCTAAAGLAAVAQFAAPALVLPAAALFLYCAVPTLIGGWDTIFKERRIGVDVLDAIVVVMCLFTLEIFAGAVLAWCLAFGRALLERAQEDSRRRLVNVFGKQPRTAYLYRDGVEILVPLDQIQPGDVIAAHTGEVIAADGVVWDGNALVDQHALTGESVPVEKQAGSKVYASTLVIGGRLLITVESAGRETATAKISAILNDTAAFRLTSQSKGEALADKAVLPTLGLASLGLGLVGLQGATAIVNCDFGTGIRMAAPLALLSSLSVCAGRGILIKDGRALEEMEGVDTVLFDKTGTLTHERPELYRIHCFGGLTEEQVLTYAAAAEQRLEHPIAAAIVESFRKLDKPFLKTDQSSFKIGYGISVLIDAKPVLVGSSRFMALENTSAPTSVGQIEQDAHDEGHSIVFVAVDGEVVGGIELAPKLRDGVREVMAGLRARGVRQIVIISGDHDKPTRKLAEALGVDRYFAEVLPQDKARYVELLQAEGRKVCFVGDGINDSIALKRANVSVSLRGASTVATDTAQLIFMENDLWKLCEFRDISRELDKNVNLSWQIILVPNLLCIGGAFFLGFGVMASVLANNVAAIAALANGLRPRGMYPNGSDVASPTFAPAAMARSLVRALPWGGDAPDAAAPSADDESLNKLLASSPTLRRSRSFFIWAGLAGLALPGVPGWPLLIVAVALGAAGKPGGSALDRWVHNRFPGPRREALRFAKTLMDDLDRRFPEAEQTIAPTRRLQARLAD